MPCGSHSAESGCGKPATPPWPPWLGALALALIACSHALWSSPEYRERHLLVLCVAALAVGGRQTAMRLAALGWPAFVVLAGVLGMQAASWIGGMAQGMGLWDASLRALQGLLGIGGLAVVCAMFLDPPWRRVAAWTGMGMGVMWVVASFAGYFLFIERFIPLGGYPEHFATLRMALIWPTRMLTAPLGQLAWEHANCAAYAFALMLVMVLEWLALGGGGGKRRWWLLCGMLGAGVFLTGSRGGWMVLVLALPLVLLGRNRRFGARVAAVMFLGLAGGWSALKVKNAMLPPAPQPVPLAGTTFHSTGLVQRGSAGRLNGYRTIWREIEGHRAFGHGLGAVGRPVGILTHEHSVFAATLRGGGTVALGCHFLVLGAAGWVAVGLLRRGIRWPALFGVAAIAGLCFDRSTVVALTGQYEFLTHWAAVWLPLLCSIGTFGPFRRDDSTYQIANARVSS